MFALFLLTAAQPESTFAIQQHLERVEEELAGGASATRDGPFAAERALLLELVREYRSYGLFPINDECGAPCVVYIDRRGVPDVIAELMIETGREDLARELVHSEPHTPIAEVTRAELRYWADANGITLEELGRLQPLHPPVDHRSLLPPEDACASSGIPGLLDQIATRRAEATRVVFTLAQRIKPSQQPCLERLLLTGPTEQRMYALRIAAAREPFDDLRRRPRWSWLVETSPEEPAPHLIPFELEYARTTFNGGYDASRAVLMRYSRAYAAVRFKPRASELLSFICSAYQMQMAYSARAWLMLDEQQREVVALCPPLESNGRSSPPSQASANNLPGDQSGF